MTNRDRTAWRRFLEAEEAGRTAEAESALAELFRRLPEAAPAPGFAARVLSRLPRSRPLLARPAVRFALAATLVLAALSAALVVPALGPLLSWIGPGGFVELAVGGFVGVVRRFAAGAAAWEPFGVAARALGRALGEPRMLALLASQLLISGAALRGLVGIARQKRSALHVVS